MGWLSQVRFQILFPFLLKWSSKSRLIRYFFEVSLQLSSLFRPKFWDFPSKRKEKPDWTELEPLLEKARRIKSVFPFGKSMIKLKKKRFQVITNFDQFGKWSQKAQKQGEGHLRDLMQIQNWSDSNSIWLSSRNSSSNHIRLTTMRISEFWKRNFSPLNKCQVRCFI